MFEPALALTAVGCVTTTGWAVLVKVNVPKGRVIVIKPIIKSFGEKSCFVMLYNTQHPVGLLQAYSRPSKIVTSPPSCGPISKPS